jgi:hypothetical protein
VSEQEPNLTPMTEGGDYPPLLNVAVPVLILITSTAYAWSLRDLVNPGMNLLLLKPLFLAIWALLLVVFVKDVLPSIRLHKEWKARPAGRALSWRQRFAPGTEAAAGLVVAATFVLSLFGTGNGPAVYLVTTFIYLLVVGYLIGDRKPVRLIAQAAICCAGIYLIMGVLLGVRL